MWDVHLCVMEAWIHAKEFTTTRANVQTIPANQSDVMQCIAVTMGLIYRPGYIQRASICIASVYAEKPLVCIYNIHFYRSLEGRTADQLKAMFVCLMKIVGKIKWALDKDLSNFLRGKEQIKHILQDLISNLVTLHYLQCTLYYVLNLLCLHITRLHELE